MRQTLDRSPGTLILHEGYMILEVEGHGRKGMSGESHDDDKSMLA